MSRGDSPSSEHSLHLHVLLEVLLIHGVYFLTAVICSIAGEQFLYIILALPSEIFHTALEKFPDPRQKSIVLLRNAHNVLCLYLYILYL